MGRDTAIYTFDKEKSTKVLYNDLQYKRFTTRTFREYIAGRIDKFGQSLFNTAENILETIRADINNISPDDLFEILLFLSEETYKKFQLNKENQSKICKAEIAQMYDLYGIELLYEVHTSTVCYSYMFQYGNYDNDFPIEDIYANEEGHNISSASFYRFNEYMILLMYRIMSDQTFDAAVPELMAKYHDLVNDLQIKFSNNSLLQELINNQLRSLHESWIIREDHLKAEHNTIYYAWLFFQQSIEMNEKINGRDVRIVIVDSC